MVRRDLFAPKITYARSRIMSFMSVCFVTNPSLAPPLGIDTSTGLLLLSSLPQQIPNLRLKTLYEYLNVLARGLKVHVMITMCFPKRALHPHMGCLEDDNYDYEAVLSKTVQALFMRVVCIYQNLHDAPR
jgi:hypothetical protein